MVQRAANGRALDHLIGAPVAGGLAVAAGLGNRHRHVAAHADQPALDLAGLDVRHRRCLVDAQRRRFLAVADEDEMRAGPDAAGAAHGPGHALADVARIGPAHAAIDAFERGQQFFIVAADLDRRKDHQRAVVRENAPAHLGAAGQCAQHLAHGGAREREAAHGRVVELHILDVHALRDIEADLPVEHRPLQLHARRPDRERQQQQGEHQRPAAGAAADAPPGGAPLLRQRRFHGRSPATKPGTRTRRCSCAGCCSAEKASWSSGASRSARSRL